MSRKLTKLLLLLAVALLVLTIGRWDPALGELTVGECHPNYDSLPGDGDCVADTARCAEEAGCVPLLNPVTCNPIYPPRTVGIFTFVTEHGTCQGDDSEGTCTVCEMFVCAEGNAFSGNEEIGCGATECYIWRLIPQKCPAGG